MYTNYKIYYQYLKNEMKRHRPTAMIELSQRKQGEIGLENDGRGVPTYASDVFLPKDLESFDFFETIADDGRLWLKIRLLSDNNPLR